MWESWVLKSGWSKLPFGNRSQRMKGAKRRSQIGDRGTVSWSFLSPYPSITDALGATIVKDRTFGVTGIAVSRRQKCRWVGLAFELDMAHATVQSRQMPEMTLSLVWLCPANASLSILDCSLALSLCLCAKSTQREGWAGIMLKKFWFDRRKHILAVEN